MKTILFLISLIFFTHIEATELCSRQGELLDPIMGIDKGWLGVRCRALNWMTWKPGWKSPCECLDQQDTWSRLKRKWPKNKRRDQEKLANTTAKVEKKIADMILTQITYNLEQSIRLDIYLKKGIVSTQNLFPNNQSFPSSCRIQKIGDLLNSNEILSQSCNRQVKEKRLQLLFGKGKTFDDWYKDQKNNVFKNAVTNSLSDKDKEAGMCMPYKSFLSINNINPLRTSYLKLASAFGDNYEGFLQWVTSRNDPNDISSTIRSLKDAKNPKIPHTGSAMDLLARANVNYEEDNGFLSVKKADQFEKIDEADIQHLLKTDPIFERMVRDKNFFKYISKNADTDKFNPNDPKMLAKMIDSQNKGCESLYGTPSLGLSNNKKSSVFGSQNKTTTEQQQDKSQKNLLTRFLCEEDFPKDFITNDVITEFLAPDLKKELGVSEEDAEDMIVDYLYCKGPSPKEYEDGRISYDLSPSVATGRPKKNDLTNLLNFKLNPASDLQTQKDGKNDYANFNNSVCKFIDDDCKKTETSQDSKCYISTLAVSVPYQMLLTKFSKQDATAIAKKITDPNYSDKEIRDLLSSASMGTFDKEADAIIIMRHQQPKFKAKEDEDELKSALGSKIQPGQKLSDYLASVPGGKEAVLDSLISTDGGKKSYSDLVTRLRKTNELRKSDTLIGDNSTSDRSSFFSNYFSLGKQEDEKKISDYKTGGSSPPPSANSSSNTTIGSNGNGNTTINSGTSVGTLGSQASTGNDTPVFYERRSFDDPVITPPNQPKQPDPIRPVGDKKLADFTEAGTPVVAKNDSGEKVIAKDFSNGRPGNKAIGNSSPGLILTSSNDGGSGIGRSNNNEDSSDNTRELEKTRKQLEDRLKRLNDEMNGLENGKNKSDNLADLDKEKRDLENQLNNLRNKKGNNRNGSNGIVNNGNNNSNNKWNNDPWNNNFGNDNFNKPFNNGYGRGEEFNGEKSKQKVDDGSEEFDPENTKKTAGGASPSSGGGSGGKGKAQGSGSGGGMTLSSEDGGDDDGAAGGGGKGKRKKKRRGSLTDDQELVAKCGTGSILKCVFPNSYFIDDDAKKDDSKKDVDSGRLYIIIANLKLEGRKFQTLEKVRKSKKEMRMGESNKAKYYLYTYDVVLDSERREVTNDERLEIFNEIKENRKNPTFKKKLVKYRQMTKVVPPKILLNDTEALEVINRTISTEEYEKLGLLND